MPNIDIITVIIGVVIFLVGAGLAIIIYKGLLERKNATAKNLIEKAKNESEKYKNEQLIKFREELQKRRSKFNEELKTRERQINKTEQNIATKENELRREENNLKIIETRLAANENKLNDLESVQRTKQKKIDELLDLQNEKLQKISGMSLEEARNQLLENLQNKVKLESAQMAIDIKSEAKVNAQREAKEIIAHAIESMAYEFTMESTLSTVQLPSEKYKGLIIGREGRNIRSFEEITGVKVIVDDTPEMIVLSAFDPVQREIARITMEYLIKTKNINPKLIEQAKSRAQKEVDRSITKAAEDTIRELRIKEVHPRLKECLGRLKYRYSYGQNMLQHSKEVSLLTGAMALELGFNVKLAKRAGLFHDIGKALTSNTEGSHVTLGVEICEKYNEHEVVINSILAHHEEAEPISPISVLVTAADKISGSRPGARRDTLEAYTKRISTLEDIANSFDGVSKTYAISAGREIRVIVEPENIDDKNAEMLATEISEKIKESMEYPGNIKVCVIRNTVVSRYTQEYEEELKDGE
ncbi:ribonuclease Y [Calditrichota bacterium]